MPNSDEFWQTMTNYARFWWTLTNYANVDIKLPGGKIQVFVDIKIAIRSQTIPLSFFIFLQFHIYITENNSQAHFDSKMLILWPVWLEFQTSKFALLDRARQSMIRLTRDSKIFRLDPSLLLSLPTIEEVNQKDFYSKMSFFLKLEVRNVRIQQHNLWQAFLWGMCRFQNWNCFCSCSIFVCHHGDKYPRWEM